MVDALIALGGVEFSETRGGLTNQRQIEEQLTDKALTNARERADKTANAMGVKIESVFAISTVSFPQIQSDMFPERVTVTGSNIPTARYTAPEYRFAPITVSQEVHVIYLISPVKYPLWIVSAEVIASGDGTNSSLCDCVPLKTLAEAEEMFASFEPL